MSNPIPATPLNTHVNTSVNTFVNTTMNATATPAYAPVELTYSPAPTKPKLTVEEKHHERLMKIKLAEERAHERVVNAANKAYATKVRNLEKDVIDVMAKEQAKNLRIARREEVKAAKEQAKERIKQLKAEGRAKLEVAVKKIIVEKNLSATTSDATQCPNINTDPMSLPFDDNVPANGFGC